MNEVAGQFTTSIKKDTNTISAHDSMLCAEYFSDYRNLFIQWKNSDYSDTDIRKIFNPWKQVYKKCPDSFESTYPDGIMIMRNMIESEENSVLKEKYIDSLLLLYDQYLQYFPIDHKTGTLQTGAILGRKGVDLYSYSEDRYIEANHILERSLGLENNHADATVMIYYLRSVIKMARNGMADSSLVIDVYRRVSDIMNTNILEYTSIGDARKIELTKKDKANIDATFEPFSDCRIVTGLFENEIKNKPGDVDLLKSVTDFLEANGCQTDSLYFNTCFELYRLAPGPETAYKIGRIMLNDNKPDEALSYFEYASKSIDPTIAQQSFRTMGEIFRLLNNYPRAYQMASKAIELDPKDGLPYITIGNLYAASANDCGTNDFTARVGYWAAVDKFVEARNIDPSVEEAASKLISIYSDSFPSKEAIQLHGYKIGSTYTVICWFTEKTIIRAAN
jgi:tetratricopeptide (TPR) repeat protein